MHQFLPNKCWIVLVISFVLNGPWAWAQSPIMLDDIHYYTLQRKGTVDWFMKHFGAKPMAEVSSNPLTFITFLEIKHGQSTINISPPGPFPGIKVGDPKRWERENITPAKTLPPMYGVHWLAIHTPNLKKTLQKLQVEGVEVAKKEFSMPAFKGNEPSKAAMIWGPDYNQIVLIEDKLENTLGIDHLLLLVEDMPANVKFYTEVLAGEIVKQGQDFTLMKVANHQFLLAKPSFLSLKNEEVTKKDPKKFVPNIDHLGFLYREEDVKPAFAKATNLGYQILMQPRRMELYEKPTPYVFGILFSPDGLQIELESEDGRTGPRNTYAEIEP